MARRARWRSERKGVPCFCYFFHLKLDELFAGGSRSASAIGFSAILWHGSDLRRMPQRDPATRRFSFFARPHRRACCAPLLPRACPALSEHLTPAAPQRAPWQHRDGCRGSGTPARRTRSRSGTLSRHALWPAARRLIFPIPAQGGAGHHRRARPVAASGTAPLVLRQAALRARRPARHRGWQPACLAHLPQRWARPPPQPPLHSADPRPSTFRAHQTVFMLCDVQTVSPPAPRGGWSGTRAPCWRKQTDSAAPCGTPWAAWQRGGHL